MVWTWKHNIQPRIHTHSRTPSLKVALHSPGELDILVDRAGNHHGDNGVVPGAEEHESETQAHPQEGQSPGWVERERDKHGSGLRTDLNAEM